MSIYKLPLGISIPKLDEFPNEYDAELINEKRNEANIIEGFKVREICNENYTHFVEINVNVYDIWSLFVKLSNKLIGDVAYGIIGFKDDEPTLSEFTKKQKILDIFNDYKFELVNDGFIQFGIAHNDDISFNEIHISNFKYFQVWTSNIKVLRASLAKFGLTEADIHFIDEFPVVSKALQADEIKGVRHYSQVLSEIEKSFNEF